ncbi:GIY-YIG nuclease family protein [Parendozoicomonas haliclonae]|uniref:GIY-YIG catalytic domain protein n=1 Tax=Parendozoicomonas haliclonae TaxID=1960125 RepID=A0A1X7AQI4_9GAMM|nr:GIY-YIG nuclease family protein [Parendozoicomonas haliclonae]SMA50350.1 hypothetical protein EHSB41UT_04147 [Parendozoicomonas haliclonae]
MIIFTVTNTVTNQVYVGSTRNDLEDQWDKMVAAAEQNMDFPLYRDIRRHGTDCFHREIYDMAENRVELAELEKNALEDLDAISLRGHKTSNVVIRKKAPVRRKASEAEKELLELLDSFATDDLDDELPMEETKKKEEPSTIEAAPEATPAPAAAKPASRPDMTQMIAAAASKQNVRKPAAATASNAASATKFDALAAAKAIIAQAAKEEEEKAAAAKAEAEAAAERSRRASRTTGNVSIDLNIDNAIDAQLAAITAAIDGMLAGDTSAANQLETMSRPVTAIETVEQQAVIATQEEAPAAIEATIESTIEAASAAAEPTAEAQPTLHEVAKVVSEKEQRILDAITRHREARAKRTSDVMDAEKARVEELLNELNNRIAAMPAPHLAMYN